MGEVIFKGKAYFDSCRFESHSYFQKAKFHQEANFTDSSFDKPANFRQAQFEKYYPVLEGTNLHAKTTLTAQKKYWPNIEHNHDEKGILEKATSSCAHLRHNMTSQGLPDEAHFFFRGEMECKLKTSRGLENLFYRAYKIVSDYGYNYTRPLIAIAFLWLIWTLVYTPYFWSKADVETFAPTLKAFVEAAGLSFANIFAFFGFHRRFANTTEWSKEADLLIAFTGLETLVGFILLFLFGLGLRNRFRLK